MSGTEFSLLEAFGLKLFLAAFIVAAAVIYFEKTSVLTGTPEENKAKHSFHADNKPLDLSKWSNKEEELKEEPKNEPKPEQAKSTGQASLKKQTRKRKT